MTREAKIGMLTGLGVIVLIGVLLSEYLGDPASSLHAIGMTGGMAGGGGSVETEAGGAVATGRMAPLPIGAGYRHEVMEPVTVPAMAQSGPVGGRGAELSSPMMTGMGMLPPTAYAAEQIPAGGGGGGASGVNGFVAGGPVVGAAVSPVVVGPSPAEIPVSAGVPPVIAAPEHPRGSAQVAAGDTAGAAGSGAAGQAAGSATATVTHTVVAGDTLAKIAKKYYDSAKNSDVQRIVAANPGILKNADTTLMVNKKLTIPGVKTTRGGPVAPANSLKHLPPEIAQVTEPVMIHNAADPTAIVEAANGAAGQGTITITSVKGNAAKKVAGVYVVQSGDTLEKIARKIAPGKSSEMVQKLISANGIKDPTALQVGAKLKVPA